MGPFTKTHPTELHLGAAFTIETEGAWANADSVMRVMTITKAEGVNGVGACNLGKLATSQKPLPIWKTHRLVPRTQSGLCIRDFTCLAKKYETETSGLPKCQELERGIEWIYMLLCCLNFSQFKFMIICKIHQYNVIRLTTALEIRDDNTYSLEKEIIPGVKTAFPLLRGIPFTTNRGIWDVLHPIPLTRNLDIWNFRQYGPFLAGPERNGLSYNKIFWI